MTTPFSVLMAVYERDDPDNFRRALRSVTADQTLRPDQIVIVRDGPVGAGLTAVLDEVRAGTAVDHIPAAVVELPTNRGLALALEAGLKTCSHDVIARADADDISLPQRFALMLPVFEERRLDLLGAAITEFEDDETQTGVTRTLPTEPDDIARTARFRDPFNHPTVVYRRRAVVAAGGYQHLNKMEDYWLFVRMIQNGARVANLASRWCSTASARALTSVAAVLPCCAANWPCSGSCCGPVSPAHSTPCAIWPPAVSTD